MKWFHLTYLHFSLSFSRVIVTCRASQSIKEFLQSFVDNTLGESNASGNLGEFDFASQAEALANDFLSSIVIDA